MVNSELTIKADLNVSTSFCNYPNFCWYRKSLFRAVLANIGSFVEREADGHAQMAVASLESKLCKVLSPLQRQDPGTSS